MGEITVDYLTFTKRDISKQYHGIIIYMILRGMFGNEESYSRTSSWNSNVALPYIPISALSSMNVSKLRIVDVVKCLSYCSAVPLEPT